MSRAGQAHSNMKSSFEMSCDHFTEAQVAKLVDALLSGGSARNGVAVRLCSCARKKRLISRFFLFRQTVSLTSSCHGLRICRTYRWRGQCLAERRLRVTQSHVESPLLIYRMCIGYQYLLSGIPFIFIRTCLRTFASTASCSSLPFSDFPVT